MGQPREDSPKTPHTSHIRSFIYALDLKHFRRLAAPFRLLLIEFGGLGKLEPSAMANPSPLARQLRRGQIPDKYRSVRASCERREGAGVVLVKREQL